MITRQLLLLFFNLFGWLCVCNYSQAQDCTPTFHKLYYGSGNDESFDVRVTSDKGSIVTGRTSSNSVQYDGFLMKLDEQGNVEWSKTYGGSEYDDLVKVRQTADGGYIAIGVSKSFGEPNGETWVIKTDGNGTLLWSKHYKKNSDPVKAKYILQLSDGSYLFAVNTNDSTQKGDGIITRIDASGKPIWTATFDNGGDDGINCLEEDGSTFLVGGYATVDDREAILMRMRVSDGSVVWCRRFARQLGQHDEIIHVEKINGGLAFAASSTFTQSSFGYNPYFLTLFKTRGDSDIFFQRRVDATINYKIASVHVRTTVDSGFIYLSNDTVPTGMAGYRKVAATGLSDWGHMTNEDWEKRRLEGIDLFGDKGYVISGYLSSFQTNNKNRIQVLKTDIVGATGSCNPRLVENGIDTTFYTISGFSWKTISRETISNAASNAQELPLTLAVSTLCSDTYCEIPDVPKGVPCYSTFITHLQDKYGFTPLDEVRVNDGYILVGYHTYYRNAEPVILKLRLDGTVAWTKTLPRYTFDNDFNKVFIASDGNLILTGQVQSSNHYESYIGSFILKVRPSDGSVIWSKSIDGRVFDLVAADNGNLIGCHVQGYGNHPIYITLFKIDPSGNVLWQKRTNGGYDAELMYRSLVYDGNNIYAAGEYGSGSRIAIEKLDLDGNSVWLKSFMINGSATSVESLHVIGDSVYVMANYFDMVADPLFGQKKLATIKIAKDGGSLSGFALNNLGLLTDNNYFYFYGSRLHIVTRTIDDNFVVAELTRKAKDSALVITKFSPVTGQIFWSRRYDNLTQVFVSMIKDDAGSLMILGRKFLHDNDVINIYQGVFIRTDPAGLITQNGAGDCHNVPNDVQVLPVTFTEVNIAPTDRREAAIQIEPSDVITRYFTVNSQLGCVNIGNCSSIEISGLTVVCNGKDTTTFFAKRNTGCTTPVLWKFSNTSVTITHQTDSSVSVLFGKTGKIWVVAYLSSSCGVIKDSIEVGVPQLVNLQLGSDTTICPGNSIILQAHKGFVSYKWNDGSSDSSFTVTQPGKYFLTVIDSCGSILSDTIIVSPHAQIPFSIGPDRTKCNTDTLHLSAPFGFISYDWTTSYGQSSTKGQDIVVNPDSDVTYFVKAEQTPGCFAYDTVRVKVNHSPAINLGNDTSFCSGKSVMLDAGAGFNWYRWSDASTQQTLSVNSPGTYSVVGTTVEGCSSLDTLKVVSVWPLPAISLDHNSELCQSSSRILDPGQFSSYQWQDGNTSRKYTVNGMGIYYVQVTDNNGCVNADTVYITTILPPPHDFLPGDTSICSYGSAELASVRSFASYRWSTGGTATKLIVDKAGKYWLQVRDDKGCVGTDTVVVNIKDCMVGLKVPNAFTPNHDAANDVFRVLLFGKVKSFELTVYNRWGQIVFYTVDRYKGWNGTIAGKDQDPGVYIWTCKYELEGNTEKMKRGTVTLIR
jgi:gliding motility-associated-like protein